MLLSDSVILTDIIENVNRIKERLSDVCSDVLSDVYDSHLYKKNYKLANDDTIILTINFNVDGMSLFKSSSRQLWPLQGVINELSPYLRFRSILTLMLYLTKNEPTANIMQTFLNLFINMIDKLTRDPLLINDGDRQYKFIVIPFCANVDAPARALMQNRLQYDAHYGCSWCYIFGKQIGSMRFLITEREIRTHQSHLADVRESVRLGRTIRGVKGAMKLTRIPTFFVSVWSFPVEALHIIYIGIVKHLWMI